MMRALFWLLGIFALAAGLAIVARYNDAYALFVWPPWRLHISLNLLALLVVAGFSLAYAATRLVSRALALPSAVAAFRVQQRKNSAIQALRDAQRYLVEGRYGRAHAQADAAYRAHESPGLAALIAARASHAMREQARCEEWLRRALEHDRDVRVARLMTEAEFAVADRRFDVAAERLETLREGGHRHIAALRLSVQTAAARGMWTDVLRLARQLASHRAFTAEQAAPLVRRAHLETMREHDGNPEALARYWRQIPKPERADRGLVRDAALLLNAAGQGALAAEAIGDALDSGWDSALAELYGRIEGGELIERIGQAERWLRSQPRDERLLLSLGRLCLQQQLWGKAQSYFEASLSVAQTRAAHLELARLAEQLGRNEVALKHFRSAAELTG